MAVNNIANLQSSGQPVTRNHPIRNWLRHFVEMFLAMGIGMLLAVYLFRFIVSSGGFTSLEGREHFPQIYLLAMALGMTIPMAAWMRFRGQ